MNEKHWYLVFGTFSIHPCDPPTSSVPSTMSQVVVGESKIDDEEERKDERISTLYEIRANLEKKLAILNRIGNEVDDEEQRSRRQLDMPDIGPFFYSSDLIPGATETDILRSACSNNHSFQKVLAKVFKRWCKVSQDPTSWISASNLLLMFKFALGRPLLAESKLCIILKALDLDPVLSFVDDLIVGDVQSAQRYRNILRGLSLERAYHISHYKDQYPRGLDLSYGRLESTMELGDLEEKEKIAELAAYFDMHRSERFDTHQAISLISNFLDGSLSHESIRACLCSEPYQSETSLWTAYSMWNKFLESKKVSREGQTASLSPDQTFLELCDDIFDPENSLQDSIQIFRNACKSVEFSAVEMAYVLKNYNVPQDLFTAGSASDRTSIGDIAAECKTEKNSSPNSSRGLLKSDDWRCNPCNNGSRSDSATKGNRPHASFKNRFEMELSSGGGQAIPIRLRLDTPPPESVPGKPPLTAMKSESLLGDCNFNNIEAESHEAYQSHPITPSISPPDSCNLSLKDSIETSPTKSNRTEDTKQILDPLDIPPSPMGKVPRNTHSTIHLEDTNMCNTSSSSEDGVSIALFGLPLATKDARAIARELKLPPDHIRKTIRSTTLNRTRRKRRRMSSTHVIFPNKKLKKSFVASLKQDQKVNTYVPVGLFARDGEDARTFVESHINASILENTKQRFLREISLDLVSKSKSEKSQVTDLEEANRQAGLRPNAGKSEVHLGSRRCSQVNSQDNGKLSDSLLNNGYDESKVTSPQTSDRWVPLPLMFAFVSYESPKDVISVMRKVEAIQKPNSQLVPWYDHCHSIVQKVRNQTIKPPESDEEKEIMKIACRLAQGSQEFKKRLAFEDGSTYLHLLQRSSKDLVCRSTAYIFQAAMAQSLIKRYRTFCNKNPKTPVKLEFVDKSHSGRIRMKSIAKADGCLPARSYKTSARSVLPDCFLTNENLVKPERCSKLLINGYIQKNPREVERILRGLNSGSYIGNTKNAVKVAFQDRMSFSLFLAIRRQLRAKANQRMSKYRYFQSSSGALGAANISNSLNKLFERYRGLYYHI